MLRSHVTLAVFKRNVASYFSGVLGYLFIIVFVIAGSLLAFRSEFFASNQANLDPLTEWYPLLLVFIIPAVTMTAWSDERKLGTDELLFTLPATDVEILLGKFFAVVAVYTTALLFSITLSLVIAWLGDPDPWQIATTYLGYWLAGVALIGAGLFASALTNNATVAFVLGALFCAAPVGLELLPGLPDWVRDLTIGEQLRYFTLGLIPLSSVLYFLSLAGFMLYLNVVMIGRRHWRTESAATLVLDALLWVAVLVVAALLILYRPGSTWTTVAMAAFAAITFYSVFALLLGSFPGRHFATRITALAIALISVNYIAQGAPRLDLTQERLYTLSETTHNILKNVDRKTPVTIQAYLSPQVPEQYADIHRRLIGLLREIDQEGGTGVDVQISTITPSSEDAVLAQQAGIVPRAAQSERGGKITIEDIFMGALVQGPYAEVIIPFFDVGTSIEYELTRSIGTVSNAERATIGILTTDAKVTGGFDMQNFRQLPEWRIVQELKKQYKVEEILPDHAIDEDIDVLIAILPSSLTQPQMEHFLAYVRSGKPTLIFDDPLPVFGRGQGFQMAPLNPKPSQGGGMMGMQQPSEPKADGGRLTGLMHLLQSAWEGHDPSETDPLGQPYAAGENFIVFDGFNPHPEIASVVRPELIFVSPKSGTAGAFNPESPVTSDLQELMAWFAGTIRPRQNSPLDFKPLLRTGSKQSGLIDWDEAVTSQSFFGPQIAENPPMVIDSDAHVIAAHITSKADAADKLNVIFVADVDLISDDIFRIQEQQLYDMRIDNVTFVLNAVDELAGNKEYIALRKRRAKLRTLTEIEAQKDVFNQNLNQQIQAAEKEAKDRQGIAQKTFDDAVAKVENDESLDRRTKQQLIRLARQDAQNVLDEETRDIERDKEREVELMRDATNRRVAAIELKAWLMGVLLPPLPAILLMFVVLGIRLMNETTGVSPDRLVKR
ncbi:MAG: Gldg family protein [Planctomycetaceae bacterium]|nr:Gldg family protein [Planctomycetaceae bacterium]